MMLADRMLPQAGAAWAAGKPADKTRTHYALRIEPCRVEIAPGIVIDTIGYNGQVPGPMLRVREGIPVTIDVRYRMIFRNGSGDQHPMHVHRHTFEVTRVGTKEFSGLHKDVVNVMPLDSVAVDFVADNPGDTLLHCHQALHMDFGFMQLMKYVG